MAKLHIPEGENVQDIADLFAQIGVTLGQKLADGSYRIYVRKNKINLFINFLNQMDNGQKQDLQDRSNDRDGPLDLPGDSARTHKL